MTRVLTSDGERSVALRTQRVQPEITTDDAKAMGIKERISTYTTTYDAGNKPRVNNIHTLADALDGTLDRPGGTFSFNGTIGPRTAAKGYQEAPAIVNGEARSPARRRHLSGGHDHLQLGLRVRAARGRAQEPLVLHLPLPQGPGRDGVVGWSGLQVQERHRRTGCSSRRATRTAR